MTFFWLSCQSDGSKQENVAYNSPVVKDEGKVIVFDDQKILSSFKSETVGTSSIRSQIKAPAKVVASVVASSLSDEKRMILFGDSELSQNYMALKKHQRNIRKIEDIDIKQLERKLKRIKELREYGATTGKDLYEIETELALKKHELSSEKIALLESENRLKSAGFIAKELQDAKQGTTYLMGDIPESKIKLLQAANEQCQVVFTAFPKDTIQGKVEGILDKIDSEMQMMNVKVLIDNPALKYKTGMFANVFFDVPQKNNISIQQHALVTVQGNHYVFVKSKDEKIERRQIHTGPQIGNRMIVYEGLEKGEKVVYEGVMQLKGLSFGY